VTDQSQLDQRYFIDEFVYNCPFCNRRHVSYSIYASSAFDWTENKKCYCYFVTCHSCGKQSMHLTFMYISINHIGLIAGQNRFRFGFSKDVNSSDFLESCFFYSVPTSFFVLDERVPHILRELLTEAEGCLKSNFLTGGSACARKIIYELAVREKANGDTYEDRIKSLKEIRPDVEPAFFDTLLTIQQITSTKVHENAYDGWESRHLRIILAALSEVLHELYVVPALREDRRKSILALKKEIIGSKTSKTESPEKEEK
jgi:hypothetical protein